MVVPTTMTYFYGQILIASGVGGYLQGISNQQSTIQNTKIA